ncbi:hypothetical protein AB6A40_002774 [Gnathostoma spinigerum]|uniref:Uncharacterized protein n=1 Tax=Gnathostoma spinigerum TaxID=75299 RepID=A0ABD6EIE0_9BILA
MLFANRLLPSGITSTIETEHSNGGKIAQYDCSFWLLIHIRERIRFHRISQVIRDRYQQLLDPARAIFERLLSADALRSLQQSGSTFEWRYSQRVGTGVTIR